jgi:Ca2+-binding RTX toxin-like protein
VGGPGDDTIFAGPGDDVALGDSGNDVIFGNFGSDMLFGGAGNDYVNGDNPNPTDPQLPPPLAILGSDTCSGGPGLDTVVNCERVLDGSDVGGPAGPPSGG